MTPFETFDCSDYQSCQDCHEVPPNRRLTYVDHGHWPLVGSFMPNMARLMADHVCDPCLLRRRLEGKL